MHTLCFLKYLLALLLSAWLSCVSSAHAAIDTAGRLVALSPLVVVSAAQAGTRNAKADPQQSTDSSEGRILFILASSKVHGTSTIPASISFGEVVNAWDIFQAAGYAVDFVSPDGGDLPILDAYVSEDVEARLNDEHVMAGLRNTLTPTQVDPARYRAVYYVGGSNAMYGVAEHPVLQNIAMHVYERNGGVVSAVCHGTAGIVNLKLSDGQHLVSGKRISGYPEEHEEQDAAYFKEFPFLIRKAVESRGGVFHAINSDDPYIEVDGRVVTGQNYASATPVAEAVIEVLRKLANPSTSHGAAKG
jgi:putative intracellular protease/amidase